MSKRFTTPREWMEGCFAKGDPELRKNCDCPPACKKLCKKTHHTQRYSPISLGRQGQTKPYTKMLNAYFRPWKHPELGDPTSATKMIYLFLLTYTRHDKKRSDTRWIRRRIGVLAEEFFGVSSEAKRRTFTQHLNTLQRYEMISLVPFSTVDPGHRSSGGKEKSVVINDLPNWWPRRDEFRIDRIKDFEILPLQGDQTKEEYESMLTEKEIEEWRQIQELAEARELDDYCGDDEEEEPDYGFDM